MNEKFFDLNKKVNHEEPDTQAPAASTEANTNEATSATPAANETAAAVKETAPAETSPATAASGTISAADNVFAGMVSARNPAPATLPNGYLANGSMVDADGIMFPEYIGEYAQELARRLKPLKASTFQRAFLTKAKEANRKKVPYSVKKNCALGMVTAAKKLVSRKKDPAPAVLLDMVTAATASVCDSETFDVMYTHFDAVYTELLCD